VTLTHRQKAGLKASLAYWLAATLLHFVLFDLLLELWSGAVFLSLPVMGLVLGALGWRVFDWPLVGRFWWILLLTYALSMVSALFLIAVGAETAICIIMGVPLYLPGVIIGMLAMRAYLRRREPGGPRIYAAVLALPFVAGVVDANLDYPVVDYSVETVVMIQASPAQVWAQTLDIPAIQPGERIWTASHGILGAPQPVSAALTGDVRQLLWTKDVTFKEIILERDAPRLLRWKFDFDAPESLHAFDPHVSPDSRFLRVTTGEYHLRAVEGGTELTLRTYYSVATPYNGYLQLWGQVFLGDFHSAVLAVIKSRSEGAI